MSSTLGIWPEALADSLERAGATPLSDEQMQIAAASIANWAEGEREFSAPTPSARDLENSEITRIKAAHAEEIKRLEKQLSIYRRSVARRHNVRESAVYTDGYNVMINPNG